MSDGDIREISLQAFRANLDTSHKDLACLETAVAIDRTRVAVQVESLCRDRQPAFRAHTHGVTRTQTKAH